MITRVGRGLERISESVAKARFEGGGRRRSVVIAVVCALAVVLVAASVFSIGQRSRTIVRDAAELHAISEALRSATLARTQLAQANLMANTDRRFGTDSDQAITIALTDARRGLSGMTAVAEAAAGDSPLAAPAVQETTTDFVRDGNAVIAAIEADRAANDRLRTLSASFERIRSELVDERDRALERIAEEDGALSRLGAFATFIVAFVVPAVAALIYMSLTRRPRRVVSREITDALRGADRRRRVRATRHAVAEVRSAVLAQGAALDSDVCVRLDELAALVGVVDGHTGHRFAPVDMDELIASTVADGEFRALDIHTSSGSAVAWTDRRQLRQIVVWLIRDLAARGVDALVIAARTRGAEVGVALAFDGHPLPDAVQACLQSNVWDDDAASTRLTAAMLLAHGIGARLSADPSGRGIEVVVPAAPRNGVPSTPST